MSPLILFDNNENFYMTVGSPGGTAIISYVLKSLVSTLYLNKNIEKTNNDPNYLNFICINILGILGSGLAFWVFNLLIKETSSVFASSVTYLIPIVAIFWGVIDGEVFGIVQFYLCLVIFCGIYLIKNKN